MTRLTPSSVVKPSPEVISADVDGETVLLDAAAGVYYGLNPTGSRAWPLFVAGAALSDVVDTLTLEYDVSREVLWTDLVRLVSDLSEHRLVVVCTDPGKKL